MRLLPEQLDCIRHTIQSIAGENVRTYVFGSRLRDDAKGGDLDLLLESAGGIGLLQRATIKSTLETRLSMPVDIIAMKQGGARTAFQSIALAEGVEV